jgi:hypothetical protein
LHSLNKFLAPRVILEMTMIQRRIIIIVIIRQLAPCHRYCISAPSLVSNFKLQMRFENKHILASKANPLRNLMIFRVGWHSSLLCGLWHYGEGKHLIM